MTQAKRPKSKDENGLVKSVIDVIFRETESENWCKTVEIKKNKRRSKLSRSETENQAQLPVVNK
jgi:hypothetical protein